MTEDEQQDAPATLSAADAATTARDVSTLTWLLSLVQHDPRSACRIRQLGDQLDDIHADYAMSLCMCRESTEQWRAELAIDERATRRALREAAGLTQEVSSHDYAAA